jgi:peptide/nickel transport system permease protein
MLAGFFLPLPYDPITPNVDAIAQPPSAVHWFGTDLTGFDVFSRVIASSSRDLPLSLIGTLMSMLLGVPLGLAASSKGRWGERIMRALDVFQAFPVLILAIAIVTLTGNQLQNVVLAIMIINIPRFMRLVRSEALPLRDSRFMEAAYAIGCSPLRLMFRHLLPNVLGVIFVQASLTAAYAIIVIASLNFIGIGVSPPLPTWGSMIQSGAQTVSQGDWWMSLFPGLAVFFTVFNLNQVAEGLDEMIGHAEG